MLISWDYEDAMTSPPFSPSSHLRITHTYTIKANALCERTHASMPSLCPYFWCRVSAALLFIIKNSYCLLLLLRQSASNLWVFLHWFLCFVRSLFPACYLMYNSISFFAWIIHIYAASHTQPIPFHSMPHSNKRVTRFGEFHRIFNDLPVFVSVDPYSPQLFGEWTNLSRKEPALYSQIVSKAKCLQQHFRIRWITK